MKILLCSPIKVLGGISRWTMHILEYNKQICSDLDIDQYFGNENNINNSGHSLAFRLIQGLLIYLPFCIGLYRKLRKTNYDIIHVCSSASFSLYKDLIVLKLAKKFHVKSIIHFHFGRIPEIFSSKNWEYKIIKKVLQTADEIIVIDKRSYEILIKEGYSNVNYIPNPLTPSVEKIVNDSEISKDIGKIVFVGHVVYNKGVIELVHACKSIPDIQLHLIGYAPDEIRKAVIIEAGENSSSWLFLRGQLDYQSTIREMLSAGIFVLPSYTEGFPNVILEAMACSCTIVATDVGDIPEMLNIKDGFKCGICVKPRDVENLNLAILKMLKNREYSDTCGKNAHKRVEIFYSMPIIWEKLEALWMSINQ